MKKNLLLTALIGSATLISCSSDDSSDNLSENARYIQTVNVVDTENGTNETMTVNYDASGRVTNVTDGIETNGFVYNDNNQLTTLTGDSDPFSISELYQAPYDGYEFGEVLDYDNNGNPIKVRLFERDYDGAIIDEYVSDIYYDSQTNPFLHTLDKAGILDVLDNVDINFSSVPAVEELIIANALLPVNNPNRFVIKTLTGEVIEDMVANYVYNSAGYPTSATFTLTNENGISVSSATYTYLP